MPDILPPPPEKDFKAAEKRYLEQWGQTYTQDSWLRLYVALLLVLSLGEFAGLIYAVKTLGERKPVFIPVDHLGRAVARAERPDDRQLKYFLVEFATKHCSRFRATIQYDWAKSLNFLERDLANTTIEENRRTKALETFLTDGSDEIEVKVHNIGLDEHENGVFEALLDCERIFYNPSTRRESGREKFIGRAAFVLKTDIPEHLTPVNPIGLTILRFREDRAFEGKNR